MERQVITRILAAYGMTPSTILAPQKGYRNTSFGVVCADKPLNLILYKSEPHILDRIKNANRVADFAAQKGMPARRTYSAKIIKLASDKRVTYGALYTYLPGTTIPWEAYTMARIKALGETMGKLHTAIATFDSTQLPDVAEENLRLNKRMLHYFSNQQTANALRAKLGLIVHHANYTRLLQATKKLPNQQALHMDFVRGNILFENDNISGILDFEKTGRGHKLFDIARTLAFLLVDCKFKDEQKVRKYFLHSGYIKRSAATVTNIHIGNIDVLEELVNFFLLHDFYKFLRHNPYESLPLNEHFMRTRVILLKRGLLQSTRVK